MSIPSPSNAFTDALRFGDLLVVAALTVYEYDEFGDAVQQVSAPVSTAAITIDRNSAIRRSGNVTIVLVPSIPPSPLIPTGPPTPSNPQLLAPFGNEVAIDFALAVGNSTSGPTVALSAAALANATTVSVSLLQGSMLPFEMGESLAIGSSAPTVLLGTEPTGGSGYLLYLQEPLSSNQAAGASVQMIQSVQLGLFTITSTTVDAGATNLDITLEVSDRSFVLDARKLVTPYKFPATTSRTFEDEVVALLDATWGSYPNLPPLTYNFSNFNNPFVPTASYNNGSSPWQMALDLAAVAGNELYINSFGQVTCHKYPDVYTAPVRWWFTVEDTAIFSNPTKGIPSGSPFAVPVAVQVALTRDSIYNDVYITGSGSQQTPGVSSPSSTGTGNGQSTSASAASPVLGHMSDDSPASATYVAGPLGILPEFTSSNLVPTTSQAQAMASLDLSMSISSAMQITVTTPPNALIDVDDVVSVYYPAVGVNGPDNLGLCMVVDTVTTSVKYSDQMEVTGRVIPGRYA